MMRSQLRLLGKLQLYWASRIFGSIMIIMLALPLYANAQSLRIGISELPAGYGNPFISVGIPGTLIWLQIYDGLTKIDGEGQLVGALAEDWEMMDPRTWRFRLRQGVHYSDGTLFTALKAKGVFDWLQTDKGRATIVGNALKVIEEVQVSGPYELVIRTKEPDPILPNRLTIVMMVEPDIWLKLGIKDYAREPIGTGSYVVRTWQNINGAAELNANAFSWRPPIIEIIEFFPLTDHAARFQAAISRQLHAAISMRPEDLEIFAKRDFNIYIDPTKQIIGLAFDIEGHKDSPIADERVRQAINYAVDKEAISHVITRDTSLPAGQGAAPGVFGYNPLVKPYPYEPDRSRELLKEAGYPDGFSISASVVIGTYANDIEIYQKVQQDLADVGIKLTVEATVFSDWIQQYAYGKWKTEAFSLAWNTTPYHDAMRPMEYFSCNKSRPFFCDQDMMPTLNAAATELDREKREHILFDLQVQFHDKAPQLFLLEYGHIWVVSKGLIGFELHDRVPQFQKVHFRE